MPLAPHFLESSLFCLRNQKRLGDGAMAQLEDGDFAWSPDPEVNSIAITVRHLHGNMLSRWTDFLTTDGEKPWRDRDAEFQAAPGDDSREALLRLWEEGWACVFNALEHLREQDVMRIVSIRGREHTVVEAVQRQVSHYGYHVGQIVMLAKMRRGARWQTLSIARGQSGAYKPGEKY